MTPALVVSVGAVGTVLAAGFGARSVLAPVRHSIGQARPRGTMARSTSRRRRRRVERELDATFPELLELLVVSIQAGLLPAQAMAAAMPHVDGHVHRALEAVQTRIGRGERFADALHLLIELMGPRAIAMVATIASTERNGLPLGPALERLADEARAQRRRHAEAAMRELPVRLAFPLVLCTLPSFALVAIVPLLVGALSSLASS